jgi:hypothetical protein
MTVKFEIIQYHKAVLKAYQMLPNDSHNDKVDEIAFSLLRIDETNEIPYNHFSSYYAYRCAWTRTELTNNGYLTEGRKGVRNLTPLGQNLAIGPI